jgi:hypothetical protein
MDDPSTVHWSMEPSVALSLELAAADLCRATRRRSGPKLTTSRPTSFRTKPFAVAATRAGNLAAWAVAGSESTVPRPSSEQAVQGSVNDEDLLERWDKNRAADPRWGVERARPETRSRAVRQSH